MVQLQLLFGLLIGMPVHSVAQEIDASVNANYVRDIKPIFAAKCFNCHSRFTEYPWYYAIPGVRQMIDKDVRAARADVDMSEDFPFQGKGTPSDYLDVIEDVVRDRSMPPLRYRLVHPAAALTDAERQRVLDWVEGSRKKVNGG